MLTFPFLRRVTSSVATACLAFALDATPVRAQSGLISGEITSVDGQPVSGAHVRLVELARHTDAAADGTYRFVGVPYGSYLIEAKSDRFGTKMSRVTVDASALVTLNLVLNVAAHEEAIVVNSGLDVTSLAETAKPITVLTGLDLAARLKSTLGETLAEQPGVSSTAFGPGASRPVIRGMGGDRVRLLQGGVGMADASNTSPDHAVSFDPLSAEQIEVLRGPATLLYGSTAIGGVVNVIDGRIPDSTSERAISGVADVALGSVSNERQGGVSLRGGQKKIAWHVDALKRKTDDVGIPTAQSVLPNSATQNGSGSVGLSYLGDNVFLGAGGSFFDTNYGIPSEEGVSIDLRQRRIDVKGAIRQPFGAFRGLKARFGASDYEHAELDGGVVGTRFENTGYEGRLEFLHKPAAIFAGAFGFQAQGRDLTVTGDEAFLPPNTTRSLAAFVLEEASKGRVRVALGARIERQEVKVRDQSKTETGTSGSLGVTIPGRRGFVFGINVAHSERLPGAEELLSNGPHAATSAFEVGDRKIATERSLGLDASVKKSGERLSVELSFFRNAFDGYVFERFTGEEQEGLRVIRYEQRDALFWGMEAQTSLQLIAGGNRHLDLDASMDYVRASLKPSHEPLPRIAPVRLGVALHYRDARFDFRGEVRRIEPQERVSTLETTTPGHTLVNTTASYRIFGGTRTVTDLVVRATNVGNVVGRNHVSYLKDVVPLPGRDVRASMRFQF